MANEILKRQAYKLRWLGLLVMISLAPASQIYAANICPWINEATASGLLGEEAVGAYQPPTQETPATCTFTQHAGEITRVLRIQVEIASNPTMQLELREKTCGADIAPLPAIGNQAVFCSARGSGKGLTEFAIGRVREQVFTIEIGSNAKNDANLNIGALQSAVHVAAEQISSNLY